MKRLLIPLVLVALMAGQSALAATLRGNVTVDGDVVRLSDLFDDLGNHPDATVARAPAPGKRVTLSAQWLARVAAANRLDWRPSSAYDQIVLERSGQIIPREQIESELKNALRDQGMPDTADVDLGSLPEVMAPGTALPSIAVRDLYFDQQSHRFTATLEIPADSPGAQRLKVSGRIFNTIEIPVLAHAVNRDDVISARDLVFQKVREDSLRRDILTDADQVIGMAARQALRGGDMLSSAYLQRPVAVARDGLVTIVLHYGPMTLSTQGKALEAGSVGDTIRVINVQSKHTLEAKVEGPSLVSIPLAQDTSAPAN